MLTLTLQHQYTLVIVVLGLIVLWLIIELTWFCKTKSNDGISIWNLFSSKPIFKNRLTLKQQIGRDIAAIIILIVYVLYGGIPIVHDISSQQFIQIEAKYSRTDRSSEGNLFSNGRAYIEVDGQNMGLNLPYGWTDDEFPEGTYFGTVWYSEESHYILAFIPSAWRGKWLSNRLDWVRMINGGRFGVWVNVP